MSDCLILIGQRFVDDHEFKFSKRIEFAAELVDSNCRQGHRTYHDVHRTKRRHDYDSGEQHGGGFLA
jgi:hypothetical protein